MQQRHRLAVLIDGENISGGIADGLFAAIDKLGEASVRRIYGDFAGPQLKPWAEILSKHAILAHQNFASIPGKNASDIALAIDAMDLLHSRRFDGFCIVSSDSDFTRLAARIREEGVDVFGFGEKKTSPSFRQACHRFFLTENLCAGAVAKPCKPASRPPSEAVPLIKGVIAQMESKDGWVELSVLGQRLTDSGFDSHIYGHARLSVLIRKIGMFEIDTPEGRGMRVRLKPATKAARQS